jgi:hypothetical protein
LQSAIEFAANCKIDIDRNPPRPRVARLTVLPPKPCLGVVDAYKLNRARPTAKMRSRSIYRSLARVRGTLANLGSASMCKIVVSIVIGLLFWQTAASDTSKPFVEPATGTTFPPTLGKFKWKRGQDRDYGPGWGVSIAYHFPGGMTATIYIYNLGLKEIPAGTKSQVVKDAFADTKSEVAEAMKERGGSAKQLAEDEVSLGAAAKSLKALRVNFMIVYKDGYEERSDAYLTGYKNQLLKIRLSYPKDSPAEREVVIKSLLSALDKLLRK